MYLIGTYNHKGSIGVLVELKCLSNATSEKADIKLLAEEITMQVAATNPSNVKELLAQDFVKNPIQTVLELINERSQNFGDSISIIRFIRWERGTGEDQPGPDHEPAASAQLKRT